MVKINLETQEATKATLEGILGMVEDTQTRLAKLSGPGVVAEAALEGTGVAAFRAKDGGLRLVESARRDKVEHEGETYIVESTAPGLFSKGAEELLGVDEAATVRRYRTTLAEVNACKKLGVSKLPSEMIGRLLTLAEASPPSLRGELTSHARSVAAACEHSIRKHGRLASSSAAGSGSPGYQWVADEYLPEVLDVTDQSVGLYDAMIAKSNPGLHQTAKIKIRVMTATGGMRIMSRQTTDTIGAFPKTNVDTSTQELTGGRAVHASLIDGVSLRDPREAVDWLAMHQRAGRLGRAAMADYLLFHGDEQTSPASHAYASAGLAALVLDHRDAAYAGDATDPLILADGLRTMSVDRSTTLDLGTLLSGAANVFSTQANALTSYKALRAKLGDQYKRGSSFFVTQTVADALLALGVGVQGTPFMVPATEAGNPWRVGTLYDGTPVYAHFGISALWNSSGVVASGSSLQAIFLGNLSTIEDITGPDDGRVEVKDVVDGDARLVVTYAHRRPWGPLPSTKDNVAFGYNLSV